jgi:hypothetical protein
MNIFASVSALSRIPLEKKISVPLLLWALLFESCPQKLLAYQDVQLTKRTAQAPRYMQWSAAFASFSSFLGNMDENRSWTSSPGKTCNNQEHDVMVAPQVVRCGAQAFGNLKTTQQAVTIQSSMDLANNPWGGSVVGSNEDYNRRIAAAKLPNGSAQAVRRYAGLHDQSGVSSDAFRGSDHQEQKKKSDSAGQAKWQVGTVTAVRPYKVPNADPSVTSYKVSVRVGNTVYVVLTTPRPGTDIGIYARGRQVPVLVGDHTITYNDRLGNSFQVPILSRTTVTPQDSR